MENNLLGIHSLGQPWNMYLKEEISRLEIEPSNNSEATHIQDDRVTTFSCVDMELYGHCPILKPFVGYVCLRSGQERPCGTVLVPEGLAQHMNAHHWTRANMTSKQTTRSNAPTTLQCKTVSSSCGTIEGAFSIDAQVKARPLQCKTMSTSFALLIDDPIRSKSGNQMDEGLSTVKTEINSSSFKTNASAREISGPKNGIFDIGHERLSEKSTVLDIHDDANCEGLIRPTLNSAEPPTFIVPDLIEKFPILAELQSLRSTAISGISDKNLSWNSSSVFISKLRTRDGSCTNFTFPVKDEDCPEENSWTLRPIRTFKNAIQERRNHKIRSVLKTIFEKPYLPPNISNIEVQMFFK